MRKNLVQKVLEPHLAVGDYLPGREIGITVDQTLTQDATGTMAYLQLEAMGIDRVRTELSVSYIDHNTIQVGFENADDHRYLQDVAARYGIVFSRAGNGICHQVHLESFARPGRTLLGSDSHTPTCGGIGMIAIGAGGLDVAVAMGGGPFFVTCPRVCKVHLSGELGPWVSAKDVILRLLAILTTRGNVGVVLEYGGPGVETLTVPQRATIANMGAETGVTTSIFPSDEMSRSFLRAQGREEDWHPLAADEGAAYDRVIELDLGSVEPLAAAPHSPGNVVTVRSLAGMKVDQVMVGSCTNSSYRDLVTVARCMRGGKVHADLSFGVAPGSRQVLQMIAGQGALLDLVDAGARICESACGFCIGNSQSPGTDAVSLRTSNRNFEGRSGTRSAQVYLVSPETAAVAALRGVVADPRDSGLDCPVVPEPERFTIDDSMFVFPEAADPMVEIRRGPNIGSPPRSEPLPEGLEGEVTIKVGDHVTTDHIMPAGPRLKYRSNVPKYARFVFENVDPSFYERAMEIKQSGGHNVIVAGLSYGQGSSREHAALCPMYLGVKAVVARSLERIHAANLVNFGIVPLTFADPADYERIQAGDRIEIPGLREKLEGGEPLCLVNRCQGVEIELACDLSDRQRSILLAGGLLAHTVRPGNQP